MSQISGFSKFSKDQKIEWLVENFLDSRPQAAKTLRQYWNRDEKLQKLHDEFAENTVSNYYLPFGVAPNFIINDKEFAIPMAIEESSVVAAASKAAKFWGTRGGFKAEVLGMTKVGQVHFNFSGSPEKLKRFFEEKKTVLLNSCADLSKKMKQRGGGILDMELRDKTDELPNYFQLHLTFNTADAMGANFINSCLEQIGSTFEKEAAGYSGFNETERNVEIILCILSNYVPECLVRAKVECPVDELQSTPEISRAYAEKFVRAIHIANVEPYRAVTHNKGIMNGIDSVVLATGNDFRAVEAAAHAYASRDGKYQSLSKAEVKNGHFYFWMDIPLSLGTVGGLTSLHPLVKLALDLLQRPSAEELMKITAVAGLAQNFGAVGSLVTTGIQKGHMKMHLMNILNQYNATEKERKLVIEYFKENVVSHQAVVTKLENIRDGKY
jgi:hydroxymethylglutaryl-CoA reductase